MKTLVILLLLCSPAFSKDYTISISEVNDGGNIRYDVKEGGHIYHFWSKEQLEDFANRIDQRSGPDEKAVSEIMKTKIDADGIDKAINDLKRTPVTFDVIETKQIQERP